MLLLHRGQFAVIIPADGAPAQVPHGVRGVPRGHLRPVQALRSRLEAQAQPLLPQVLHSLQEQNGHDAAPVLEARHRECHLQKVHAEEVALCLPLLCAAHGVFLRGVRLDVWQGGSSQSAQKVRIGTVDLFHFMRDF